MHSAAPDTDDCVVRFLYTYFYTGDCDHRAAWFVFVRLKRTF